MAAKRPADAPASGGGGAAGFFTPRGAKAARGPAWSVVKDGPDGVYLLRTDPDSTPSAKVAAFDMDGTLVVTKSGGKFARDGGDWKLLHASCVAALRALHAGGYRIVIFSNQGGIKSQLEGKRAATVKAYFDAAIHQIGVPATAFVAPGNDGCRKPACGMWRALAARSGGLHLDAAASFFVGDAAGRAGDHSDSDAAFARALQLRFYLPEQAFAAPAAVPWPPLAALAAPAAQAAVPGTAEAEAAVPAAAAAAAAEVVVISDDDGREDDDGSDYGSHGGYDTP